METYEIGIPELLIGSLIIIIPVIILWYYRTKLVRDVFVAFGRMALQLTLAGIYLKYVFELNSVLVNFLWLSIMAGAAGITIVRQSELKNRYILLPVLLSLTMQLILNGGVIALIIVGENEFFHARYMIPISGMLLGNSLTVAIIGLRSFYNSLRANEWEYKFSLMCGASKREALFPYKTEALKSSLGPSIANTASIGLIWLPGMMTGQLLGGSDPITSIKYQIMIILTIFVGSAMTVFISLFVSAKIAFDRMDMLNRNIFLDMKRKK